MEHVSLDGVISPSGDDDFAQGGWQAPYRSPAGAAALAEAQGTSFDLLLGRRTYDSWADIWPKVKGGPFADGLNAATKYVATHRPESLGWGPIGDLGADILEGIRGLKSKDGPDLIVWGSSTLTSVLLGAGTGRRGCADGLPGLAGPGQTFSFRTAPTRANWRSSARRPRPRACSSTSIDTLDRCEPHLLPTRVAERAPKSLEAPPKIGRLRPCRWRRGLSTAAEFPTTQHRL